MTQPQYIIVSGIDGSGKTSIIEGVREQLERQGKSVFYVWLRYNHRIVKPIHGLCRLVGLSRKRPEGMGKTVWRHEFYRCRPFCSLYICLTYLDTLFGKLNICRRAANAKPDLVICDRWIYDIMTDLAVDTRRPNLLSGYWLRRFEAIMPKDARQYLVKRDMKDILDVRPECDRDREFLFRSRIYGRLEKMSRVVIINNDRDITCAVDDILEDVTLK